MRYTVRESVVLRGSPKSPIMIKKILLAAILCIDSTRVLGFLYLTFASLSACADNACSHVASYTCCRFVARKPLVSRQSVSSHFDQPRGSVIGLCDRQSQQCMDEHFPIGRFIPH